MRASKRRGKEPNLGGIAPTFNYYRGVVNKQVTASEDAKTANFYT